MHTPGPWKAIKDPMIGAKERWCVYAMEDENYFRFSGKVKVVPADCFGPNAKSNARFIAAAPDLLAACKFFIENLPKSGEVHWEWRFKLIDEKIRAAIAKAEGKS